MKCTICSIRRLPPDGQLLLHAIMQMQEKNGAYCNYILIPIEQKHSTSIKDTTAFINTTEFVQLSTDALLITYNAMYANMEFEELLNAIELAYTGQC